MEWKKWAVGGLVGISATGYVIGFGSEHPLPPDPLEEVFVVDQRSIAGSTPVTFASTPAMDLDA